MSNKFDIKTKNVVIGSAAAAPVASFELGAVPAGKQRFVTFIKAVNLHHGAGATNTLYIATNSAATIGPVTAATSKALTVPFRIGEHDDVRQIPGGGGDIDNPLFNINASHHLVGCASQGDVDVFVNYYDD